MSEAMEASSGRDDTVSSPSQPRKKFDVTFTSCACFTKTSASHQANSPPTPHSALTGTEEDNTSSEGAVSGLGKARSPLVHSPASNSSSNSGSPFAASSARSREATPPMPGTPPLPPRTAPVPLITPRYQKKSRTTRHIDVTDSFPAQMTPTEALRQHTTETMTIHNGAMAYDQTVHFHTYDLFRYGRHRIHSRSVGYSSDGDLVMTREDYSEPSDVDNSFTRRQVVISEPTVLVPGARRPLTAKEQSSRQKLRINRPRYKKYPGIHIPRNRKLRNRLMNDYFANEYAQKILHLSRQRHEAGVEDDSPPVTPFFTPMPDALRNTFDVECGAATAGQYRPRRNYIQPVRDPDSGEARLQALNLRLRAELQHALLSEFLSRQIEDLDVVFSAFVRRGVTAEYLVFRFRDGYGRLLCHGVAAYYQLSSESRLLDDGTTKHTYVGLPRQRRNGRLRELHVPYVPLLHMLRRHRGSEPARHSLSANTTPALGPQAADSSPLGARQREDDTAPMSPLDLNSGSLPVSDAAAVARQRQEHEDQQQSMAAAHEAADVGDVDAIVSEMSSSNDDSDSSSSSSEDSEGEEDADVCNTTVCMTVNGTLVVPDVPVYVPQLRLCRRRHDRVEVFAASAAAMSATSQHKDNEPDAAPPTPPLTVTQRRKQKKAERAAARQS